MCPRCLPEEFLLRGHVPYPAPTSTPTPTPIPGLMPATEVLTQGKHLKTEWLPGRRKKKARMEWDGVGHGDRKSSKDSQVGRLPRLSCPGGQFGRDPVGMGGSSVTRASAGGGSISSDCWGFRSKFVGPFV